VKRLQEPPLRDQCIRWLQGADLFADDMAQLCEVIAELLIATISERPGEAQHAKTHATGRGKPRHTDHYQSYHLRADFVAQEVKVRPTSLESFAYIYQLVDNTFKAIRVLGLEFHPMVGTSQKRRDRDRLRSKVVYHSDRYTLYTSEPPALSFHHGDDPGACSADAALDDLTGHAGSTPSPLFDFPQMHFVCVHTLIKYSTQHSP
jgi:hypothetical protein